MGGDWRVKTHDVGIVKCLDDEFVRIIKSLDNELVGLAFVMYLRRHRLDW